MAGCRASATSWHQWHSSAVFHRQSRAVSKLSWCHTRQPAVTVWSHCCAVLVWLLSVATDLTSYPVTYARCCRDHCPDVHCLLSGLLQLAPLWCAGEPAEEVAVSAECCRLSAHQHMQMWPHHSGAASERSGIQEHVFCTPVTSFTCTNLPDDWHSSHLVVWSLPSVLVYW